MEGSAKGAKERAAARRSAVRKFAPTIDAEPHLEQRLKEALEQQGATSEILRVISSSRTNAQPVFDIIAERAAKLCKADIGVVSMLGGTHIELAALYGLAAEGVSMMRRAFPMRLSASTVSAQVIRDRAVVHIADVLADPEYENKDIAHVARYRGCLGVPMLRDEQVIGSIFVARSAPGFFAESLIELLKTFADQAVIAIENVRLFKALEARNTDLYESLEQQTATSDILRVISSSQTDVQPVFDTIVAAALKLCSASSVIVMTFDGELLQVPALAIVNPEGADAVRRLFPRPLSRDTTGGRAVLTCSVVAIPDVLEDSEYAHKATALASDFRSILAVPLMREGSPIGSISVGRPEPGPFPDKQIALLQTFADQAVIAIENVRLFKELESRNAELSESLEQQTATSEILRVISQSQTDVQPIFDTIAAATLKLCRASSANVLTFDGELMHLAAMVTAHPEGDEAMRHSYPRRLSRDIAASRAVMDCDVVTIADVLDDRDFGITAVAIASGFRSILAVPLVREGRPIGAIAVGRPEPGPFADELIALLQTFADQAVIAIENVRLFTELAVRNTDLVEALEQQMATSQILRVISQSPTDVQPVFDTIVAAALKLCRASAANVFTFDGELVHLAALANTNPEYIKALRQFFPRAPSHETGALRAILTCSVVEIPDVAEDPEYAIGAHSIAGGFRSVLAVPLIRDGRPIGAIAVGRVEAGPIPDEQIALLQTFADQAVIAIENVRLFKELEARTTELTRSVGELRALGEIGQAVSSTLDLGTVLSTIVSRAKQLAGMDAGAIYEYDETREEFYLHATDNLPDELVAALRAVPIRKGEGALGRLAVTGEPVQVRNIVDGSSYQSHLREILIRLGYRSLLAVPLLRESHLLGGLVVNRKSEGEFLPQVIELLKTFATQSALAIQNARLFREIEDKSRQLEVASQHKSEFLANMSHELRTPLNAIIGFSEVLSERMFGEINAKQEEYLADILESGRHLLSLINDILDLSKIEAGRMELDLSDFQLPASIGNTLVLVRERAQRRGITLRQTVDERLGTIRGDERKVKQVLLNLLSNALKFTPDGGRIDVNAHVVADGVEISVTDTGVGIAPADQAAVFEEFRQVGAAAQKIEGTGLGLAISRKFIELHGGKIRVESELGRGATFAFTLPLTIARSGEALDS